MKRWSKYLCLAVLLGLNGVAYSAVSFTYVTVEPSSIDLDEQQSSTIRFRISEESAVSIDIYRADDVRVRHYSPSAPLPAGEHEWKWDGKDDRGHSVPSEAYFYTLQARQNDQPAVTYDLTDITGGNVISVSNVTIDRENGTVRYALNYPARIFLRAELTKGLLLDTLINSEVRDAGTHEVSWEGLDSSGNSPLSKLDELNIFGRGYRLPRNAIIVHNSESNSKNHPQDYSSASKRLRAKRSKTSNEHFRHARSQCKDFTVLLSYDGEATGIPLIKDIASFKVDLLPEERNMVATQRFEVSFYVDHKIVHENEVSYAPYRFRIDPERYDAGEHILTAVVIAYGSHVGSASMKFRTN